MREGFRQPEHAEEPRNNEVFERYFTEGEITKTRTVDMPDDVQEKIEALAMLYLHPDKYEPGNFHDVQKLTIAEGDEVFIASKNKDYGYDGVEESTYIIDHREGEVVGYSELRWSLTDKREYFKHKPFVGYTLTVEEHQRKGLSERRLRIMNALSRQKYGHPIYSDTVILPEAKMMWKKLVLQGRAEKFKEGEHDRYKYIAEPEK